MTEPLVRAMQPEDREAVIALLLPSEPWTTLGYTRADWERYFTPVPQNRDAFVVEETGHVAGIAVLREKVLMGDDLELYGIGDKARSKGLGAALLRHIESIVFARTRNLFACVSDFNQPARAFYRKHGYREIGSLPDLIISGRAEILLRKTTGTARIRMVDGRWMMSDAS